MALEARLEGAQLDDGLICDSYLADGWRVDDVEAQMLGLAQVGRWPTRFEIAAVRHRVARLDSKPDWAALVGTPAVAANVRERASLLPLDRAILTLLPHLQQVCRTPRLYLKVEEQRLPISRARRTPARAIADLVSHPGDWEHRTLRSIQPARVLARTLEDEWSIYENLVAVRLVDHLLTYLAQRVEELREIERRLTAGRDHSEDARNSYWRRARRVTALWADVLNEGSQRHLLKVIERLDLALRQIQALLNSRLYSQVPRTASVGIALQSTNILVNDPHYRKVARLWRLWASLGHRRDETREQRLARRHDEGDAWDRFTLLLVVRALDRLGMSPTITSRGWRLQKPGFADIQLHQDDHGVVHLEAHGGAHLRILPTCSDFADVDAGALSVLLARLDGLEGEVALLHCGATANLENVDRATGWSFGGRATLLSGSPWRLDAEERMQRFLSGWLNRRATPPYPPSLETCVPLDLPAKWSWLSESTGVIRKWRWPTNDEKTELDAWTSLKRRRMNTLSRKARDPRAFQALEDLKTFAVERTSPLAVLHNCPVCGANSEDIRVETRHTDTGGLWVASCGACDSEWSLRHCESCGVHYRALATNLSLDLTVLGAHAHKSDWPDRYTGRDIWAQRCAHDPSQFRCPECGECAYGGCARCATQ